MKKGSIHINTAAHGPKGSALILVVVLTVLLAAVGVLFLMTSRIDEMASSGIVRTRELRAGVNVVLDRIRTVLTDDLFGINDNLNLMLNGDDPCALDEDEYWDYPGDDDPWLANLEPAVNPSDPCDIYWLHITDLYGHISAISSLGYVEVNYPSDPITSGAVTRIISENEPVGYVENPGTGDILPWGTRADADGDGVADSRWIALPGISSSRGENIYAAVRIIDNCGMININTAYRDPTNLTTQSGDWDGSLLAHVNLERIISSTDAGAPDFLDATAIQYERFGNVSLPFPYDYQYDVLYEYYVSRRLLDPLPGFLPFDIGDELELRNRYFLTSFVNNRFGYTDGAGFSYGWPVTFDPGTGTVGKRIPYVPGDDIGDWFDKTTSPTDPSDKFLCNRRHISTTYSFDRVIAPRTDTSGMPGNLLSTWNDWTNWDQNPNQWSYRPVYINDDDPNLIAAAIWLGLPDGSVIRNNMPQFTGLGWTDSEIRERLACQLAVNLADFIDRDSPETVSSLTSNGVTYYGHEATAQQLYISMIAVAQYDSDISDATINEETHWAIELYNPGPSSINNLGADWSLEIYNIADVLIGTINLPNGTVDAARSYIITDSSDNVPPITGFSPGEVDDDSVSALTFSDNYRLVLRWQNIRTQDIIVDIGNVPDHSQNNNGLEKYTAYRGRWRLRETASTSLPIWDSIPQWDPCSVSLSNFNTVASENDPCSPIQTTFRLIDEPLRTVGEFTNVLALGTMYDSNIGRYYTMPEFWENIRIAGGGDITDITAGRIDLQDSRFANIFRYLTIFAPFNDGVDNDGNGSADEDEELAVAGRININTAPWFVIAQLPWVQDPSLPESNALQREAKLRLARAIVAYRDGLNLPIDYSGGRQTGMGSGAPAVREELGFANIAELINVTNDYDGSGGTYDLYSDIRKYSRDILGSSVPLDFTADLTENDLEERDILFHRISNLVTVRSDVFTAYILVRIGQNGPQKRMIAVFDRSGVFSPADRPKLVVLHPVPDPR